MPPTDYSDSPSYPAMPDQHVLQQLERLLEQTLQNPDFHPKELTLAIDVFGRSPDYDTAADPIVRTTANEIRKRLGSYFHDTGDRTERL